MTKETPSTGGNRGTLIRISIFGALLLVVIFGAIWEFGLAIPGFKNAMENLEVIAKANMADAKSRADVVLLVTAAPAKTDYKKVELSGGADGTVVRHQRIDRYKWSRIIPGKKKLELVVNYEYIAKDSEEDFSPESCSDDKWSFKSFYEPGNAPANVSVQARKPRPISERIFLTIDDDVDSYLTEKELASDSTILARMDLFDPNGDKKISLEEFTEGIKKMEEKKGAKLNEGEMYGLVGGKSPGEGVSPGGGGGPGGGPGGKGKGPKGKGPGAKKGKRPDGDPSGEKKDKN